MSLRHSMVDLIRAIKLKDVEEIRNILSNYPELLSTSDYKNSDDHSPLWKAMLLGYEDIVELLIREFGADPDEKCNIKTKFNFFDPYNHNKEYDNYTFIQFAASWKKNFIGKYKVVKVLLRHGANVHAALSGTNIERPLQIALSSSNLKFAEFLLQNGADLQQADRFGESPAAFVFAEGDSLIRKEILLLLIKYGLDLKFVNEEGDNILHLFLSFEDWYEDVVEITEILLIYGLPLDGVNDEGYTPLHSAILLGYPKIIPFLLERGANVNTKCKSLGMTPLMEAVEGDFPQTVRNIELLLSKGAKINAQCKYGWTALHIACRNNDYDSIVCLIQRGADISIVNKDGHTPFGNCLRSAKDDDDLCIITMIKEFSKLSFENIPFSNKDMDLLQKKRNLQEHFENCKLELSRMKATVFHPPYSYYSVLKMSKNIKKLAKLTNNDYFVSEFKKNLSFSYYENDLRITASEAITTRNKSRIVDSRLNSIFGKIFPEVVLRILANNLTVEDLPLE